MVNDALSVFPERLKRPIEQAGKLICGIYEIRLIADISVYFFTKHGIRFIDRYGNISHSPTENRLIPYSSELDEITDRAIGYSGFSHERELKNGFITYKNAVRIGICCDGSSNTGMGKISSLCVRIPYFQDSRADVDYGKILSFSSGLLIAGTPASGKTTLLRNIAKRLSDGTNGEYKKVCVIDERGELTGEYPSGYCTDVIRGRNKADAILHAVRLMSPQYIVCDEIGSREETKSLLEGLNCGVSFIASMHAGNLGNLVRRQQFRLLFNENVFDKVVFLSSQAPGKVEAVYNYREIQCEISRTYGTLYGDCDVRDIPVVFT